MPNVRHEESLEGILIPEFIQEVATLLPSLDKTEEDTVRKSDSCAYNSQYREDQ